MMNANESSFNHVITEEYAKCTQVREVYFGPRSSMQLIVNIYDTNMRTRVSKDVQSL